ncbi:MAG: nickel pincer cofactor biosynthesis protein LarC [Chitinophagales bacterium]
MKIAYFDCFSGISGDMILGALCDLGADLKEIEGALNELLSLPIKLDRNRVTIKGISATDVLIDYPKTHRLASFSEIKALIENSSLEHVDKERSLAVFDRLADAESAIHGVSKDNVHFHELGDLDTIIDIVGSIIALRQLQIGKICSSPIPLSRGFVSTMHGLYPLPAPAALALLRGVPCEGVPDDIELVTPTGAAILTTLCDCYSNIPDMKILSIGYGAGKLVRKDIPNVLRIVQGEVVSISSVEQVGVIETNLDDSTPELLSALFERFFSLEGSLDLTVTPTIMKKNRPGLTIQCLVVPSLVPAFTDLLFRETTTIGVRYRIENRYTMARYEDFLDTRWGRVKVKRWIDPDGNKRVSPEYESCKAISDRYGVSVRQVYEEIWGYLFKSDPSPQ